MELKTPELSKRALASYQSPALSRMGSPDTSAYLLPKDLHLLSQVQFHNNLETGIFFNRNTHREIL